MQNACASVGARALLVGHGKNLNRVHTPDQAALAHRRRSIVLQTVALVLLYDSTTVALHYSDTVIRIRYPGTRDPGSTINSTTATTVCCML